LSVLYDASTNGKGIAFTNLLVVLDVVFSIISVVLFPIALGRAIYNKVQHNSFRLGWLFTAAAVDGRKGTSAQDASPRARASASGDGGKTTLPQNPPNFGAMQQFLDKAKEVHGCEMILRDCGSGGGTNGCLYASLLAGLGKKPGASREKCDMLRKKELDFAFELYENAICGSTIAESDKGIMKHFLREICGGTYSGPLTAAIKGNILAAIAEHEKRFSPAADGNRKTIAVSQGEEDAGQYAFGQAAYFSSLAAEHDGQDVQLPDGNEAEKWTAGFQHARVQCDSNGPPDDIRKLRLKVTVGELIYSHIMNRADNDGRTAYVERAIQILEALPQNDVDECNYPLILIAFFLLNFESVLFTDKLCSLIASETCDNGNQLRNDLSLPADLPFPTCIQALFHVARFSSRSGHSADAPDLAILALLLEKDIVVYSTGRQCGIQAFGKDGSVGPLEIAKETILLHHTGNHYQAFLPERPTP
jgi:hypothetical protein